MTTPELMVSEFTADLGLKLNKKGCEKRETGFALSLLALEPAMMTRGSRDFLREDQA